MELNKTPKPQAIIDLHCDTLTDSKYTGTATKDTLDDPKRALSLSKIPKDIKWAQFFAIFVPDKKRGQDAIDYYEYNRDNFYRQMEKYKSRIMPCSNVRDMKAAWEKDKLAAFLTIENGSALAGDLNRVEELRQDGVKAITLVWNGENELGSGHTTDKGLSEFGKTAVSELEKHNIIVDCSHLNDQGFSDLLKIAKKPFIASHSNARSICSHKRNLTDPMILEMVNRDCLIGLNYYIKFIKDDGKVDSLDDLYLHIEHFIKLGAEKNLALGSDFDGALLPDCLKSPKDVAGLYQYFISKGLSKDQADGIMYKNAQTFFENNLG